ncbi:hypothetical protein [Kocuria palustris]|uniref:Uncharacterized protein n=1 Tax=Kocuria palustris PEL TaxID=1236550 RepID=M2WEN9_9MICC|nr:hypothetical protein [Kocuria palustris]EME36992.1 hypothetical protein C884_02352 [Kocuria palustris PEL]MCM3330595.1 hypothetical protein [Kocuria palustris]
MSKKAEKKAAKAAAARQAAVENRVVDAGDWLAKEIGALAPRLQDGVRSGAISLAGGIHTATPYVQQGAASAKGATSGLRSRAAVQAAKSAPQVAKVAAKVAPVGAAVKASPQAAKALKAANDGKLAVSERYNATAAQLAQRFADADTPEQFEAAVARLTGNKKAVKNAKKAAARMSKDYAKQQKKAQKGGGRGLLVLGLVVTGLVAGAAAFKASRPVQDPWKTPASTSPRVTASPVDKSTTVAAGHGVKVDDAKADSSVKGTAKSVTEDAKQTVNEIKDQINGTQNEKKDGQA